MRLLALVLLSVVPWQACGAEERLEGDYFLVAMPTLEALTVTNESGEGATLGQAPRQPGLDAAQLWTLMAIEGEGGKSLYQIRSKYNGRSLLAANCDRESDVEVKLLPDAGSFDRGWTVEPEGRGHRIEACGGARRMTIAGAQEHNQAKVILEPIAGQPGGQWLLYPAVERSRPSEVKIASAYDNLSRRYYITALPSARSEEARLDRLRLSDYQPSGLYVYAGETLSVIVRGQVTPPDGLAILVAPANGQERSGSISLLQEVDAAPGRTDLAIERDGLVYFRYLDTGFSAFAPPPLQVEVAGGTPIPLYVLGKTRFPDWLTMLSQAASAPVVEFVSEHAIITATRAVHKRFEDQDPAAILGFIERLVALYNEVSGLDGSSALHEPSPLRLHYRQEEDAVARPRRRRAIVADDGVIHVSEASMADLLRTRKSMRSAWSIWCVTGQSYEQSHWPREIMGEEFAGIYALHAAERLGVAPEWLMTDSKAGKTSWRSVVHYFTPGTDGLPDRNEDSQDIHECGTLSRAGIYEQLRQRLGPQFYPRLHQYYRAHPLVAADTVDDDRRLQAFVLRTSIVAGRDLSRFFRDWDLPVAATTQAELRRVDLPPVGDHPFVRRPE
ncbi:M60 family metallopeptidase [Labrys sp. La1]|uniref:M60 family metallopeptidase n=1 Tax=Labrys sp. La1 TaxID=3404917 RepID=UPI003EB7EC02